jgi:hypothetical protein
MAFTMRPLSRRNNSPAQRFMVDPAQFYPGPNLMRRQRQIQQPTDTPFSREVETLRDLRSPQDLAMAQTRQRMLPNVMLSNLMGQGGARAGVPGTGVSAGDARNVAFGGNTFLGQAMWGRPGGLASRGAGFDLPNPSGKGGVVNAGQGRGSRGGGRGGGSGRKGVDRSSSSSDSMGPKFGRATGANPDYKPGDNQRTADRLAGLGGGGGPGHGYRQEPYMGRPGSVGSGGPQVTGRSTSPPAPAPGQGGNTLGSLLGGGKKKKSSK